MLMQILLRNHQMELPIKITLTQIISILSKTIRTNFILGNKWDTIKATNPTIINLK